MVRFSMVRLGFTLLLASAASAQVTQRANLASNGSQANGSSFYSAISTDGRYVAFESGATNLVPGDTNGAYDIFVRDRLLGTTERVNVATGGGQSNGDDFWAPFLSMSADGRFVGFTTNATNLVAGDTNNKADVFVHDRQLGATERISVSSAGAQALLESYESSISADGRYVAFRSYSSNLVAGDSNGWADVFVRDRQLATTVRVSVDSNGGQSNSNSQNGVLSADGRFVVFTSYANNLVPGDSNGLPDVFVHELATGTTTRASVGMGGAQPDGACTSSSISADGRFVAFESEATNLVPGDTNGVTDAFVFDRQTGTTERVSVSTSGAQGNAGIVPIQFPSPMLSGDGRFVVFVSESANLVNGDTNGFWDVFVRDRVLLRTERVSIDSETVQGDAHSQSPRIASDGRFVSFSSWADNLVPGDTNNQLDIFVHDLDATNFTSLCSPGVDGVMACPCQNPPSGTDRGCENSSLTGGAILSATGVSYLSQDSLVFTTSGQRPTALSILTQWTGGDPAGATFGMGVRCTSGNFKRLYTKIATGGSITAPDFGAGDVQVSVRSVALGQPILPGDSRWYLVYYRDPNVLGGCAATATFNGTQTGQVTWSN